MTCPLIGRIAVTADPGMASLNSRPAVRLVGYRGHDTILVNPDYDLYDRLQAILGLVSHSEGHSLIWNVACSCTRIAELRSA